MADYTRSTLRRLGLAVVGLLLLSMVAAFTLGKLPWVAGTTYYAEFSDASGLRAGNVVQVGGIRVGRVSGVELDGNKVRARFTVDDGIDLGESTTAGVEVLNLLGEKFLRIKPAGEGSMQRGDVIPLDRTTSGYDIVSTLGELTTTSERIDQDQLAEALDIVAKTMQQTAPEFGPALDGVARISRTVASRDAELEQLLRSARGVSTLLAERSGDLTELMKQADLVFAELRTRREAVHRLLVNATRLADELRGIATDNQRQIRPALAQVNSLLEVLNRKDAQLRDLMSRVGPYASILGNILGTGPWFDAYAVNLAGFPTGEFVPGGDFEK